MLQLFVGLVLYGWTMAMLVQADLGLDPWDVFHQGVAGRVGLTFGQVVIVTGAFVLLGWLPLRQKPGVGTVANVIVIGLAEDLGIAVMQRPDSWVWQCTLMIGGIVGNGLDGAMYHVTINGSSPVMRLRVCLV